MSAGLGLVGMLAVLKEVGDERARQDQKWGQQNHDPFTWLAILGEEVGEANNAALEAVVFRPLDSNPESKWLMPALTHYREELIQVAAVAVAMVECLDRGKWNNQKEKIT